MRVNNSQSSSHPTVSRRRFVQAAGASGIVAGLSGCLYGGGSGNGNNGNGSSASGTVQWAFNPTEAQEYGDQIKQLFHDAGLSDDITLELVPGANNSSQRQQKYNQLLNAQQSSPDLLLMDSGWTIPFI